MRSMHPVKLGLLLLLVTTLAHPASALPVLDWSTYLGGHAQDSAVGLALDPASGVWVTGYTRSEDYPVVDGWPRPSQPAGKGDVAVTGFAPDGSVLLSTYLGTEQDDVPGAIKTGMGNVYVVGTSLSDTGSVGSTAFLASFDTSGDFHRFDRVPVAGNTTGLDVLLDISDTLLVSGLWSHSGTRYAPGGYLVRLDASSLGSVSLREWEANENPGHLERLLPAGSGQVWGLMSIDRNGGDALLLKLDPLTLKIVSQARIGGSGRDTVRRIALDAAGNVWMIGTTTSTDLPLRHPIQRSLGGKSDAFVTEISPKGVIIFSTYLGGSGDDDGAGLSIAADGSIYATGSTSSADFPLVDPLPESCGAAQPCDGTDAWVARLAPGGVRLYWSTRLGGSGSDTGVDIVSDATDAKSVYVTGTTASEDFPVRHAFQPALGSGPDLFVAHVSTRTLQPVCTGAVALASTIWPADGRMVPVSIRRVTDPEGEALTIAITAITQDEPLTRKGKPDATGLGTPQAHVRASRIDAHKGGDGRVYHVTFRASDPEGSSCTATVKVCVPLEKGQSCVDEGALVDSTQ
jgi:hypothetical protein